MVSCGFHSFIHSPQKWFLRGYHLVGTVWEAFYIEVNIIVVLKGLVEWWGWLMISRCKTLKYLITICDDIQYKGNN